MEKRAALVVGAGDALGGAIARRFAREGFVACVVRRHAEKLEPLVEAIRAEGGDSRFAARRECDVGAPPSASPIAVLAPEERIGGAARHGR